MLLILEIWRATQISQNSTETHFFVHEFVDSRIIDSYTGIPTTPNRSLGPAFANTLAPVAAAVVRRLDPLTGTILTAQGRIEASQIFSIVVAC
jgi:hypothetical protein